MQFIDLATILEMAIVPADPNIQIVGGHAAVVFHAGGTDTDSDIVYMGPVSGLGMTDEEFVILFEWIAHLARYECSQPIWVNVPMTDFSFDLADIRSTYVEQGFPSFDCSGMLMGRSMPVTVAFHLAGRPGINPRHITG